MYPVCSSGRSTAASGDAIDRIEKIIESIESNFVKKMFSAVFFFSWGGLGGRSRSNHFKKFAKANFLKWCRGGVWGGLPPQETPLPVPCPPGGSGGLRPPGISVNYPCLASAAAVPCPRALPPIFFVRICSSEFFREDGSDFDDFWTV